VSERRDWFDAARALKVAEPALSHAEIGRRLGVPFPKALERHPRVRQSLLATFDACPLSARFDLELRQGWSTVPAATGQIVHRALAKCLEHMVEVNEPRVPVDVAMSLFDEVMRQADVPMDGDPLNDTVVALPLRAIADARVTVKTWAMYSTFDVEAIAGIEKRLDTTLRYPDENGELVERVFTAKPDLLLINGHEAVICDWKSGWSLPAERLDRSSQDVELAASGDNISPEGYFQQRAGALLTFHRYARVQRVVLREVYPRYLSGKVQDRKGRPINPVREATIDRYVLPELEAEFSALIERFDRSVESGVFRPAPGVHCSWCPRPEACTIFPSARQEGRITSPEEAERVAGRLTVLDAMRTQATKALRPWSNLHGDVPIRGAKTPKVYGPVVRQRTLSPDAEAVAAHVAAGGRPQDLYRTEDYVTFCVHSPDELHPHAAAARREETALLEMERAAAERRAGR
jgi:hypothetical protein